MTRRSQAQLDGPPLWQVVAFQREQRERSGARYWWDNATRVANGSMIFQYTVAGSMTFRDGSGDHPVPTGHAALFTYGEATAYGLLPGSSTAYHCTWIALRGAGLEPHWADLRKRYGSVVACGPTIAAEAKRVIALADPRHAAQPTLVAAGVHAFVMRLYTALGQQVTAAQSSVERAIAAIRSDSSRPWSLKEAADQHGVSREHLTRAFAIEHGMPPSVWLAAARLRRALGLLTNTNLSVQAIAEQSGFASTHTLARQVRQETGKSPRAWRQQSG